MTQHIEHFRSLGVVPYEPDDFNEQAYAVTGRIESLEALACSFDEVGDNVVEDVVCTYPRWCERNGSH